DQRDRGSSRLGYRASDADDGPGAGGSAAGSRRRRSTGGRGDIELAGVQRAGQGQRARDGAGSLAPLGEALGLASGRDGEGGRCSLRRLIGGKEALDAYLLQRDVVRRAEHGQRREISEHEIVLAELDGQKGRG